MNERPIKKVLFFSKEKQLSLLCLTPRRNLLASFQKDRFLIIGTVKKMQDLQALFFA